MAELTAKTAISCRLDVGTELPETIGLISNRVLEDFQLGLEHDITRRPSDSDWPLPKPGSLLCIIVEWFGHGPNLLGGIVGASAAMQAGLALHGRDCWARSLWSFSNC